MPSLKDYRDRIASVKSTRKITSAMKMVAASKLRRAQEAAEAGQPYAEKMAAMLQRLAANVGGSVDHPLLVGTGTHDRHVVVVVTSDRGLCGGFNVNAAREARRVVDALSADGKSVRIVCVGRKGRDQLRRTHGALIAASFEDIGRKRVSFAEAASVADWLLSRYGAEDEDGFDVCTVVYNRFVSVISQKAEAFQLMPFQLPQGADDAGETAIEALPQYEFEPDEEAILSALLPRNVSVQLYRTLLDSAAGEQAARMTAMDNATRNAGDMINNLTLTYNRARQAYITKELIEIISGAEAV